MERNDDFSKVIARALENPIVKSKVTITNDYSRSDNKDAEKEFSRMMGYLILFKSDEDLSSYMLVKGKEAQKLFLKRKVAEKIGIKPEEISFKEDEIIKFIFENYVINGYFFHAANSASIAKKMEKGLYSAKTDEEHEAHQAELLNISLIYKKYTDTERPLGWGTLDAKYGNGGWFFDGTPENALYYAESPEWFNQFCGESLPYSNLVPDEERHGYRNRDYETSLRTITALLDKYRMTDSDRKQVLDFFEKNWKNLENTKPRFNTNSFY